MTVSRVDGGSPVDLTGAAARMQVRQKVTSPDVVIELNATNGRAVLTDAVNGEITLSISAVDTALLPAGVGVYDLEIAFAGGQVDRLLEGKVRISPEVTR